MLEDDDRIDVLETEAESLETDLDGRAAYRADANQERFPSLCEFRDAL